MSVLRAPFPWMGGKRTVAALVWERFGDVPNYVEPFAGSLAVLLGRPARHHWWERTETVNDLDGFVANFWRAVQHDPEAVAVAADWPVNETDQHARHSWLVRQRATLTRRLEGEPDYFDAKIAGWWVWGLCGWIGAGWCSGDGPWQTDDDGQLVHLGDGGNGIHRQLVHLGDGGNGIHRQLVHLGDGGQGHCAAWTEHLISEMQVLADRLRRVRVCSGDWTRVLGPTPTIKHGTTAVLLDPPYSDEANRTADLYAVDSGSVAHDVRRWAIEHGDDTRYRIALCGYQGEHAMPDGWRVEAWKAAGGYGSQGNGLGRDNAERETIWFSPGCLEPAQGRGLFDDMDGAA